MRLKRALTLLIALVMTLSLGLTGCGKTDKKEVETGTKTEQKEKPSVKEEKAANESNKLEPVQLTWYVIGNGQPEDMPKIEEKVNEYLKDKINATLKIQFFDWGSYDQKLRTMIAAGEEFDICFTCSWTNNYQQQAVKGAYIALNDEDNLLEKYAPRTKEMIGEDFLRGSRIDGINYAIPANKEKPHQWGFIIRKDLIDKYADKMNGIMDIKTLEDIEPYLQVIKENEPNVYALEALNGESPFKLLDFDRVGDDKYPGVVWNDDASKVLNEFELEETKALFETMNKFYKAGYIRQDAATVTDFAADENAGKIFAAVKSLKPGKDAEMTVSSGYPWVQVAITPPIVSNRDTSGSMQAISRTSKNPERALMFLELFNTDPYLNNLINFGIEGVHYEKIADNVIKAGPENEKYNPGMGWMFGNQFINYLMENEDPKKWEQFKAFNDSAAGTQTLGFVFNPDPVKTEIAACNNVWDQFVPSLETGTVDPNEYLPKAAKAFKAAGADKIIAEKQKQLDEWKAAQ